MTDKVQKIREEVEIVINRRLNLLNGDYFDLNKEVDGFTNEIMDIIDSLQEEPVSEELEKAAEGYAVTDEVLPNGKVMINFQVEKAFKAGANWQKENLWKDAQGDDLPEIDREVVAFVQDWDDAGIYKIVFAHRPNPIGWDGKSITTGEVSHYTPETYDKGGWNIPDVKYWLDCSMPKRNRNMSKVMEGICEQIVCPHWFRVYGIEGCMVGRSIPCNECNHPDKRIEKVKWSSISTKD